jgi:hypothetical protein
MVNICFASPILPGALELVKKFAQEDAKTNDHDEFYKVAGISQENIWIQRSPPGSGAPDLEIVNIETNDPSNMFKEFATSNHPYAVKYREFAKKAYGIDLTGPPPPPNEHIVDWQR